jgi:hypothetical protein
VPKQPTTYPWTGTVIPWSTPLRSKPSFNAHRIVDIPKGKKVTALGHSGGWLQVEVPNDKEVLKGYVSHELINPVLEATKPTRDNLDKWKQAVDKGLNNSAWDFHDSLLDIEVCGYNSRLAATKGYKKVDWKIAKALLWATSGGPDSKSWTTNPLQVSDAVIDELKHGAGGVPLIVSNSLSSELKVAKSIDARLKVRAGVANLFLRMAKLENKNGKYAIAGWTPFTSTEIAAQLHDGDPALADKLSYALTSLTGVDPTTFSALALTAANITDTFLRKLSLGKVAFLGKDGVFYYAILPTNTFRLEIIRKTAEIPFSSVIAGLPADFKVVINGNYFDGPTGMYARANLGDVFRPDETKSIGDVIQGGVKTLPDEKSGSLYAYFGRGAASGAASYRWGLGNPPVPLIHEGTGGLGPMIGTNPATKSRIRYGVGNLYLAGKTGPAKGDPGKQWMDCIQRNNDTYRDINEQTKSGVGEGAVGVSVSRGFLVALVKPHNQTGTLDDMRDRLWDIGVDGACFVDGSNSVLMAVDRKMVVPPADFKDNLIEVGLGFRHYSGC